MIYVLHENDAWLGPLRAGFAKLGLPHEEWFLSEGRVDFGAEPPPGVFYNRMSASSHTRGHRFAPELTHAVLGWLELRGRRVVNGSRALALEISKVAQLAALRRAGIPTPRTVAAVGPDQVLAAADGFGFPCILKPNRGGKGLGVRSVSSIDEVREALSLEEGPLDGVYLIQEYVRAREPRITRCEFIGGRFLYAVEVDTSQGFELCPAEACRLPSAGDAEDAEPPGLFRIRRNFSGHPIVARYESFLAANDIEVAGIELIESADGGIYTYDVNTNTNYNAEAEAEAGLEAGGMERLAAFLGAELDRLSPAAAISS